MDKQIDGKYIDGYTDRCIYGQMDRKIDGQMDRWMNIIIDG